MYIELEEWIETCVDFYRSEAKIELDFPISFKDENFKYCLSDGDHFSGLWLHSC